MKRAFDLFEQIGNVIQTDSGPQSSEVTRPNLERRSPGGVGGGDQAPAQRLVDDLPERPARPAGLRLQLRRHIFIQRQRCAHIMMLVQEHHDVKAAGCDPSALPVGTCVPWAVLLAPF